MLLLLLRRIESGSEPPAEPPTFVGATGSGGRTRRRPIMVEVGRRAYWFETVVEAQAFMARMGDEQAQQPEQPRHRVRVRFKPQRQVEAIEDAAPVLPAIPQVDLSPLVAMADAWNASIDVMRLLSVAEREAAAARARLVEDDEDDELLLLL